MLNSMRKHATGWVVKVLFGVLIASFAIWGIGDVLRRPGTGGALATVAGQPITDREVLRDFDSRYRQLEQSTGGNVTRAQAASFGLMNQALSAAVAQRLVDAHARDLKLTVSDEDLARTVHDEPAFRGEQGFDRSRLDMYLRGNNMSEQGFLAMIRDDTLRQRLLQSMTAPVTAPADVAQRLLAYRDEQRSGRVLMVDASQMQVEAPDDAALKAYLDANAKKYEAPEFRTVTLVLLSPDDLANEIKVDDAAVKAEYDNRIGEFTTPETRSFDQLVAPDEAVIRQAQQMAAQGQGFDAIAAALKDKGVDRTQLADVKKGELPDALDKAVFGTAQDAVAEPVEDPFGWHLLRVTAVKPQAVRGFDEVKDQLAHDLALQQANDQLPKLSTKLDDAIAAGTPLDQAAEQVGTKAIKVDAVDKQGQDKAGQPAGGGKLTPEMLDAIFAAPAGQPSLMNQLKDGRYYVFRVDNIEPAHPRPLDEVREQVANDWKQDQQGKKAKAEAEELRTKVTDAQSLDAVAAGQPGASVRPVGPLKRTDQGFQQGLRPEAVAAIFRTPAGSVAPGVVEGLDGWAIVAVDQVSEPKPDPALVDKVRQALANDMRADILQQYEQALRERYTVSVDEQQLAQMMQAQTQQGQ